MSRVLLTWELGGNLGHLSRLLPIAQRLKEEGHEVLVATKNVNAAAMIFGLAGIPFVQAPSAPAIRNVLEIRPTGYADTLLLSGWADRQTLSALVQAWITLFRLFDPKLIVLDYSPTARLAAYAAGIACVLVGTGFDIPPATTPLPTFPGFSWATPEKAAVAEQRALDNANVVLERLNARRLDVLADILKGEEVFLLTFPELDHYGARSDGQYIGQLEPELNGQDIDWPDNNKKNIFAYIRQDRTDFKSIIEGLQESGENVICYSPGVGPDLIKRISESNRFILTDKFVNYQRLYSRADLCFSYSALGTITSFLLRGIPQLLAPQVIEGHLTGRRIEEIGAGVVLRGEQKINNIKMSIKYSIFDHQYKIKAARFRNNYLPYSSEKTEQRIFRGANAWL